MTTEIKYLVFKGIEKKEQILFKSFLNLAKNELEYQVIILKEMSSTDENPNIVIADSSYEFSADEEPLNHLPTIRVGNDLDDIEGYIVRPVQWSDFKTELTRLDMNADKEPEAPVEKVLPKDMEFVIVEMDDKSQSEDTDDAPDADDYDYELDNLSIDYHSFTNSEYMKVVDDVKGFKDGDDEADYPQPLVLVSDDESASVNSVLVIETNSLDAWEMSESDVDDEYVDDEDSIDSDSSYVDAEAEAELTRKLKGGTVVESGSNFWKTDAEIYSGREQLLFIKPERDLVYSHSEPGKWTAALRKKTLTNVTLAPGWRPTDEVQAFPISRLVWANTIATKSSSLMAGLDPQTEYILERWPHFDLLELDNMLLKLCTMMFVRPESPHSLMQKSGYGRTVIYGLVNACNELDLLRVSEEFDLEKFSEMNDDAGVFGKIKEVFRT